MNIGSIPFLCFVFVVAAIYRLLARHRPVAVGCLILASLLFYTFWNPLYCIPLLFTSILDYWVGRGLGNATGSVHRRLLLLASLTGNLSVLIFLKYFNFLAANLSMVFQWYGGHLPQAPFRVVFAAGISFYTFQSMGYVIDVFRRNTDPVHSYRDYLSFVCFFPTLLSGPISRADQLLPQIQAAPAPLTNEVGGRALFLIALGLMKKGVIAAYLGSALTSRIFELPGMYTSMEVLVGIYAYAAQIYCDFSGYTDIVTGAALLLGVSLRDNFNAPYRSRNLTEFWRRWHISFSNWLREYLYFALPGNKAGGFSPYVNIFITFCIGGIWHGASWNFLIWGALHGVGLALMRLVEKPSTKGRKKRATPFWKSLPSVLLTFHFVCLTWVFFRCRTLDDVRVFAARLGSLSFQSPNLTWLMILAVCTGILAQWFPERWYNLSVQAFIRLPAWSQGLLLATSVLAVRWVSGSEVAPFIYFSF